MPASAEYSRSGTQLLCTLNYVVTILSPLCAAIFAYICSPAYSLAAVAIALAAWLTYISFDGAEFKEGRPDRAFSENHCTLQCTHNNCPRPSFVHSRSPTTAHAPGVHAGVFRRLRSYFPLTLHRAEAVQAKLLSDNASGQAIFAFFPHGVNSDFRVLMDGMMYDAFPETYAKSGPARTLAATILFKLPGIRQLSYDSGVRSLKFQGQTLEIIAGPSSLVP